MSEREPVTVFKCPCGRYIVTPNGLDDHLKTCRVLLDKVNTSGNNSEDDTPLINPSKCSKPDVVVGNVFGVEIIEFLPPQVSIRKYVSTGPVLSISKRGRLRKVVRLSEETFDQLSDSDYEEDADESSSDDDDLGEDDYDEFLSNNSRRWKPGKSQSGTSSRSSPQASGTLADDYYTFKCSMCPYTRFRNEDRFNWHMENVHVETRRNYTCPLCGRMFNKRDPLQRHLKHHENAEAFEDAFKLWESWPRRKTGPESARMSLTFACKYCLISHSNHTSFITHMKKEHPDKGRFQKILCPYCKTHEVDTIRLFLVHMRTSHKTEYYGKTLREHWSLDGRKNQCPVCLKQYSRSALRIHLENQHSVKSNQPLDDSNERKFDCPITNCFAKIKTRIGLRRHFILHLENCPYVCPVPGCGVKCDARCHLKRHIKYHTGEDLFKCPKCNVYYSRKDTLKSHECILDPKQLRTDEFGRLRVKSANAKPSVPGLTDILKNAKIGPTLDPATEYKSKKFSLIKVIKADPVYLKVIKENPEFEKTIFGKYSGKFRLHQQPKEFVSRVNYKCKTCSVQFFDKKALGTHLKICETKPKLDRSEAGGLVKVGCPICGKSFDNFGAVVAHATKVHPRKIFKCDECERMYSARYILDRHFEEIHVKKYRCSSCSRRFKTESEQTEHRRTCTGSKECTKCGQSLVNFLSWKRHWKLVHGEDVHYKDYNGPNAKPARKKKTSQNPKQSQKEGLKSPSPKKNSIGAVKLESVEPVCSVEAGVDIALGLEASDDTLIETGETKQVLPAEDLIKEDAEFILP